MTTPAGWYDDGSGRQRWWDGSHWTEHFADQQDPDVRWSAVGKPLSGIGAGRYRATEEYLIFERGTLSTKSQQIRMREIHDVDAAQSMTQKARGVGTITLWARRESGNEKVELEDIPNFREGVTIINRLADESRHRARTRQNTTHVNYTGAPTTTVVAAVPAPMAAAPAEGDLNAEIARLAAFHSQGVLTDEEFAAGKRRLLGL